MTLRLDHPRVLIVDDDDVFREAAIRLLGKLDTAFEGVEGESMAHARELLAQGQFDCVLLDHRLGDAMGLDLLPYIKAHRPEICPVILVTSNEADSLIVEAMRNGVSDYISKRNVSLASLGRAIRHSLMRAADAQARIDARDHFEELAETLRSEHERSLRQALEQAQAAHRAKSLFVANMSHEIRTPLNAVIGLCYLLQHSEMDPHQTGLVDKIRGASKALLSIVNNVLDVSKLEAGAATPESAPFRLDELVREVASLAEVQIGSAGLAFAVDLAADVPTTLNGDAARLHQVLLNLVTNAVKFTERGEVRLEVRHEPAPGVALLRFSVIDTGIGIAPDVLADLFQPFVQADATTSRRYGGTGLGLSIARQAVELMGGRIGADSRPGEGSTFWFELPFEINEEAGAIAMKDEPSPGPIGERLAGLAILLVDDSSINLEVGEHVLMIEGAEVDTACNGQEAVQKVLTAPDRYDIVLMDLQMPVMNGYDAFRSIATILEDRRPPVLALTAGAAADDDDGGCTMDGLVIKPFDIDAMIAKILGTIDARRAPPPAEPSPPPRDEGGWPPLPGIDIGDARTRLPDDLPRYLGHLRRLVAGHDTILGGDGAAEPMIRRMHQLKGSAGMLGAHAIQRLASEAEKALRSAEPQRSAAALDALVREMGQLEHAVEGFASMA